MSAHMVGREHVAYMVGAAMTRRMSPYGGSFSWYHRASGKHHTLNAGAIGEPGNPESPEAVGQMLWNENLASIHARYPDTVGNPENVPGPVGESYQYTTHRTPRIAHETRIDPGQVVRAVDCYEYQACEHEGWRESSAAAFCETLRRAAVECLVRQAEARRGADFKYMREIRTEAS